MLAPVKSSAVMERYAVECDDGNVSDGAESNQPTGDRAGSSAEGSQLQSAVAEAPEVVTVVNILVMNANVLLGKDPERLNDFRILLASRNPKPDIFVIQELGGTSRTKMM